jgi:hypothetical protein
LADGLSAVLGGVGDTGIIGQVTVQRDHVVGIKLCDLPVAQHAAEIGQFGFGRFQEVDQPLGADLDVEALAQ